MKKIISILLVISLLLGATAFAFAAEDETYSDDPVIIVPGYGASPLFMVNEDGSRGEQVWGWNIFADALMEQVKQKFPGLLTGAVMLTLGSAKQLGKTLGEAAVGMFGRLAFNGDGESVYDIAPLPNDPALCRLDVFEDSFDEDLYSEKEIGRTIDDYVPRSQIYNFAVDFRYGARYNADRLNEFVEEVKAATGKDKVNLYGVSHGGQVTAAYLRKYGERGDVRSAVMNVPAIGGTYMAYDVLTENVRMQEDELLLFIENALYLEQDFELLLKTQPLEFLDDILAEFMPYVKQIIGNWESLWDFLPYECYTELFDTVDREACAGLIEKTTDFHENTMAHFGEALRAARDNGINVNIVAGTGNAHVTGTQQNSDAIINVTSATGAKTAPWGKRFADGTACAGGVCSDLTHEHMSPSMEIDASCGYLPENTWYVDGMFHGMSLNESGIRELLMRLLLTDEIADINSDPAYPQFLFSENLAYAVYGEFSGAAPGFITGDSDAYTVTNLSDQYDLKILSIRADGLDVRFEGDYGTVLAPGESARFSVTGSIPGISAVRAAVTITYLLKKSYTPLNSRTLPYTVKNGAPAQPAGEPYADADFVSPVASLLPAGLHDVLKKAGLMGWLDLWFALLTRLLDSVRAMLKF